MNTIGQNLEHIKAEIPAAVEIVAVSKTKPIEIVQEAYDAGQRVFGENRVQELIAKHPALPKDIQWHMIGHLQRNKVKYIAPFIHLIQSVDSYRLLETIHQEAVKNNRIINVLLQVHIAEEEHKFGFSQDEITDLIRDGFFDKLTGVKILGLMGMATYTNDELQISKEFKFLARLHHELQEKIDLPVLSMGMSGDYNLAIDAGSNMLRIGTKIFGSR